MPSTVGFGSVTAGVTSVCGERAMSFSSDAILARDALYSA
jgi:hypothetical protein